MALHCPCCRQALPDKPDICAEFGGHMALILDALERAGERGLTVVQLADIVYADQPGGGPNDPHNVIQAIICNHRKRLAEFGYAIVCNATWRGKYRLFRVHEDWPIQTTKGGPGRRKAQEATV
jgi:hypothetical protein